MHALIEAPVGALQFEITHPDTVYQGESFWVLPVEVGPGDIAYKNWECQCTRRLEVLSDTCSPRMREAMIAPAAMGVESFVVCTCVGRVIE